MKKLGTYFLLAFYLIASTGFSASVHFCSEKVAEIAVISDLSGSSCGCGEEIEESSCCKEKKFEYKVDTKHLAQANVKNVGQLFTLTLAINQPLPEVQLIDHHFARTSNFKLGQDPPLRILHCVYRL